MMTEDISACREAMDAQEYEAQLEAADARQDRDEFIQALANDMGIPRHFIEDVAGAVHDALKEIKEEDNDH